MAVIMAEAMVVFMAAGIGEEAGVSRAGLCIGRLGIDSLDTLRGVSGVSFQTPVTSASLV